MTQLRPNVSRIQRDIEKLSEFVNPNEPGHTRIFFSEEYRNATDHVANLMEIEAELTVRRDAAGNLIGLKNGRSKDMPSILVGSHLDTVRGGGRFDGIAGVVAGLEISRRLRETGRGLDHPLEIVAFLAEEPSSFGLSTIGSKAVAGKLTETMMATIEDSSGITLGQAIDAMGGRAECIRRARRQPAELMAYLEMHIEQGPVLEQKNIPIGVVSGIVGISRGTIRVRGKVDHAGTTPMSLRKDALSAAADIVLALENFCLKNSGLVGTIGQLAVYPNSSNVVPGEVTLGFEIRSLDSQIMALAIDHFKKEIDEVRCRRKLAIDRKIWLSSPSVHFDPKIVDLSSSVCEKLGLEHVDMPSWAGHDANHMAELTPTGMIFVPSRAGRSHCPEEWTEYEHLATGTAVLWNMIAELDKTPESST